MIKTQNGRSLTESRNKTVKKLQCILYVLGLLMIVFAIRNLANNSNAIYQFLAFSAIITFGLGSLIKSGIRHNTINIYVKDNIRESLRRKIYYSGLISAVIAGLVLNSGAKGTGVFFFIIAAGALFIAGLIPIKWVKRAELSHYSLHEVFTPENITIMVSLVTTAIGLTTTAIKGIKLWMDERKSRKIKIKYQDIELEISGPISEDEIFKRLEIFKKFKQEIKKEDVNIILLDK